MGGWERLGAWCFVGIGLSVAASCSGKPVSQQPFATSSAAITGSGPTVGTFVVYAANNVTLGTGDHSLGGGIGVATTAGTSPQLTVGSQDQLDINQTLFAPTIVVGNLAQVGAVDTNTLTNSGGQVGTTSAYPTSMPPLPAVFPATPGPSNVTVAAGHQQTLTPGSYGTLTDDGQLFLSPGTYSFTSVTLGNNGQLQAKQGDSTSVLIAGTLSTGTQAEIVAAGPANNLTISVSGTDGANGSRPTVSIGTGTQIIALIAAPNGSVFFGNNVQATGAFAGLNFSAGNNVHPLCQRA